MAESRTIRVTPNVLKALDELQAAVRGLPAGPLKKRGRAALDYLSKTFAGEPQPLRGAQCPKDTAIIK